MKKQSFKIFILSLISFSIIFLVNRDTKSCGPTPEPDDYYSIFDKSLFDLPDLKPFFLSEYTFADNSNGTEESALANLKEWLNSLKGIPTIDHIEKVVYQTSIEQLNKVKLYLKTGNDDSLSSALKGNSFIKYMKSLPSSEIIDYLIYAKSCESFASVEASWQEKKDLTPMYSLITAGIEGQRLSKSRFIKERYAYQVIRLYHYTNQPSRTIDYYNSFFKGKNKIGLIQYWALSHKAGAIYSKGNVALSNYIFAIVFDNCPSRRRQCLLSFEPGTDSLFAETLKLCRSNKEKVVLYTMSAYINPERSIQNMSSIFNLEPKSRYLELILAREISRLEIQVLPTKWSWGGYKSYLEEQDESWRESGNQLFEAASKIAAANNTRNPYLWYFAAGYLATLTNKTDEAENFYLLAKKSCPKEDLNLIRRIQVAEVIAKVNAIRTIDKKVESELLPDIKLVNEISESDKANAKEAYIYIMNTLARKYWHQHDTIKTHLCLGSRMYYTSNYQGYSSSSSDPFSYDIKSDYHLQPIDRLFEILSQRNTPKLEKNYSEFDNYLINNYQFSSESLSEIQAKAFISKGMFNEAVQKLKRKSDYNYDPSEMLPANPFLIHINDCHDCDYRIKDTINYTILSFSNRMIELKELATKDQAKAAEYYYLYANGLYNKSFYGNCWSASAFNKNVTSWGYSEHFNKDFYDCSEAQQYYLKAAGLTKDREFAAKCLFMASKCELNTYYNTPGNSQESTLYFGIDPMSVPSEFRTMFKRINNEYFDTKYYQEILKECKSFSSFAGR